MMKQRRNFYSLKIRLAERDVIFFYGFYNKSGVYSDLNVTQYEAKCSKRFVMLRPRQTYNNEFGFNPICE